MIKPPSNLREYSLIFSRDPALKLPSDENERDHALSVARQSGDWAPLLSGTEEPTVFQFVPLPGDAFEWLSGEGNRSSLTIIELGILAFRLALRRIDNFGGHKVQIATEQGRPMATIDTVNALYAALGSDVARDLFAEFGSQIIERARNPLGPKS